MGVGMYLRETGDPADPAVLFLHGAGVSGRMWREHMARLSTFHCLAPDLPGFGRSNRLPFASRTATAELVAELVRAHIPGGRLHVVGLSWGGAIAHALLDGHPGLVDRAVIDGAGLLPSWRNGPFLLGMTVMSPFLHTRPIVAFLAGTVAMDEVGRDDLRASSRRAFRQALVELRNAVPGRVELEASSPILLVAGEREAAVRASNAALAALMSNADARYVPGRGHGWLGWELELHVRMVEAWLTGQMLPSELLPEPRSSSAARRLLSQVEPTTRSRP